MIRITPTACNYRRSYRQKNCLRAFHSAAFTRLQAALTYTLHARICARPGARALARIVHHYFLKSA